MLHMELSLKVLTSKSMNSGFGLVLSIICSGEKGEKCEEKTAEKYR